LESKKVPVVSAVIPCLNEEKYIGDCIASVVESDFPKDSLEIFVVDGLSSDSSRDVINKYCEGYDNVILIDNPKKILAAAWNLGIKHARGDIIIAMNAHAKIEPDYIKSCLKYLDEYEADCVGPVIVTHPQDETLIGKTIATAMSHPFGVGNSKFRTGVKKPTWVDTVHLCAYKKEVFDKVGVYNEELIRSQDIELHMRLKRAGGKILLAPGITIHYYTRTNPKGFIRYGFINGYWVTRPYCFGAFMAGLRHLVPLFFVLSILLLCIGSFWIAELEFLAIFILILYGLAAFAAAIHAAITQKRAIYIVLLPFIFASYHITYGFGALYGMVKAIFSKRFWLGVYSTYIK